MRSLGMGSRKNRESVNCWSSFPTATNHAARGRAARGARRAITPPAKGGRNRWVRPTGAPRSPLRYRDQTISALSGHGPRPPANAYAGARRWSLPQRGRGRRCRSGENAWHPPPQNGRQRRRARDVPTNGWRQNASKIPRGLVFCGYGPLG